MLGRGRSRDRNRGGGGAPPGPPPPTTLAGLSDVDITDPQDGDELVYVDGVWINQ